jgi:nucleotide-binding universal stress UspA family protein
MYARILAPIDGSPTSAHAFDEAIRIAHESGAELQPLYVVDTQPVVSDSAAAFYAEIRAAYLEEGGKLISDAAERMARESVKGSARVAEVDLTGDDIAHRILRCADEFNADLVVMGTHGRRGWRRLVIGSVAERFLRLSHCPVLLIPGRGAEEQDKHAARQTETAKETS